MGWVRCGGERKVREGLWWGRIRRGVVGWVW